MTNAEKIEKVQPPHAIEAEHVLLGTILRDNEAYHLVSNIVGSQDFHEGALGRIFAATARLIGEGRTVTPLTVLPLFRDDETLKELKGGPSGYFASLAGAATITLSAPDYARAIAECARQRRVLEVARLLGEGAVQGETESLDSLISEVTDLLISDSTAAGREKARQSRYSLAQATDNVVRRVNTAFQQGKPAAEMAHPGSADLARAIGGWRRNRMYVIASRPSVGKTTVATSWLLRTAFKGHGVLIIELEMEAAEIAERCLSDLTWDHTGHGVSYERITRDDVTAQDIEQLVDAQTKLANLPLRIEDKGGLTVAQVRAIAQQVARQMEKDGVRLDVICIDHMGLLRASERYSGNKVAETEEVSAAMKQLAKDLDVAVICLVQLNRAAEARETKTPALADLRWSGSIEQDADVVMLLHRPAYYIQREHCATTDDEIDRADRLRNVEHVIDVNIAKNRGGGCPQLRFYCDMAHSVVRDMENRG